MKQSMLKMFIKNTQQKHFDVCALNKITKVMEQRAFEISHGTCLQTYIKKLLWNEML